MKLFNHSAVGMEIDSGEIRIVQMEGKPERSTMKAFARLPLKKGIVEEGRVNNAEELGSALSELWLKAGVSCRDVVLGVNNQDIIVRFATLPKVPLDKLDNLIRFQSIDYIPIPVEEIELDYTIIGEMNNEAGSFYKVLLVAGRKKMLFAFLDAFKKARLNISDITASMLSMSRLLPNDLQDESVAMVNLSNDFGNIVILDRGEIGIARTFKYPGDFNPSRPEEFMDHAPVRQVPDGFCSFLAEEIRSSVRYYRNQNPEADFRHFAFTGCVSRINGMIPKMKQLLESNVFLLDLKQLGGNLAGEANSMNVATDYSICACLAIHGLEV